LKMLVCKSMDEHQHRLMNSLEKARGSLLTSIEGLDESAPVLGDWTVKDIIAHLVSWGDELRSEIREILIDLTPHYSYLISSDRDYDAWNRSQVAARKCLSLREMLGELERDYQETLDLVKWLAPGELQRRGVVPWRIEQLPPPKEVTPANSMSVADLVKLHIQHMEEHAEDIRRLCGRNYHFGV
jgi:hypothetical protein